MLGSKGLHNPAQLNISLMTGPLLSQSPSYRNNFIWLEIPGSLSIPNSTGTAVQTASIIPLDPNPDCVLHPSSVIKPSPILIFSPRISSNNSYDSLYRSGVTNSQARHSSSIQMSTLSGSSTSQIRPYTAPTNSFSMLQIPINTGSKYSFASCKAQMNGSQLSPLVDGQEPFPFLIRQSPASKSLRLDTKITASENPKHLGGSHFVAAHNIPTGDFMEFDFSDAFSCSHSHVPRIIPPLPYKKSSRLISTAQSYDKYKHLNVEELDAEGWKEASLCGAIEEVSILGEGAGGSVTKCRLRTGSTFFALKTITSNPNPDFQKQLMRELQINRHCKSPHIVKYYGTFLDEQSASIYIAMEFCGGGSLEAIYKQVKKKGGRIGEKVLGKVAEGVLLGLAYLHSQKIIHRDIKPQNILLDHQGQVKLCDFGVSGEVVNSLATTFTGTSYYMAPERIQGEPYTATSDVWSLGLTIMEVAQHKFPFLPETHEPLMPIELLTIIVNLPPPELQDEPSEGIRWSQSFRHFLHSCLEKDPFKRASPRQMLTHPWIVGQSVKSVKMDKFVRKCWS